MPLLRVAQLRQRPRRTPITLQRKTARPPVCPSGSFLLMLKRMKMTSTMLIPVIAQQGAPPGRLLLRQKGRSGRSRNGSRTTTSMRSTTRNFFSRRRRLIPLRVLSTSTKSRPRPPGPCRACGTLANVSCTCLSSTRFSGGRHAQCAHWKWRKLLHHQLEHRQWHPRLMILAPPLPLARLYLP